MLAETAKGWRDGWLQEGLAKGRKEGILKGRKEGVREGRAQERSHLLRRLLEKRFGPIPGDVEQRIDHATTDELLLWADRLLDANRLCDIFDSE